MKSPLFSTNFRFNGSNMIGLLPDDAGRILDDVGLDISGKLASKWFVLLIDESKDRRFWPPLQNAVFDIPPKFELYKIHHQRVITIKNT